MQVLDWVEPSLLAPPVEPAWGTMAIERIPQLVCVIDDDGRLQHANEAFLKATRVALNTVAPWSRFLSEEEAWSFHRAWLSAVESGQPIDVEGRLKTDSGDGGRWHLFRFCPGKARDGRRLWFGTLTDVHEQKEISRELTGLKARLQTSLESRIDGAGKSRLLSASGERYRKKSELLTEILDSMFEAIVLTDADGKVLLSNTAARDLFGRDVWAFPAAQWTDLIQFLPVDGGPAQTAKTWLIPRALDGEEIAECEIFIARPQRPRLRFESRAITLWDEVGQIRGCIAVFRDVTSKRLMEVQLAHLQKLEAIGHLAAGIAHEINTPIQYVGDNLRFIDTAFRSLISGDGSADLEFLKGEFPSAILQSLDGVGRVASIVRAMKEFAAAGSDEPTTVQLNRVIENVVEVTRNEWKYTVEMTCDLDPKLPAIVGHPRDLNQCVYHLIMNSLEAIRTAKVSLGFIRLKTRFDRHAIELTVADNGCGMTDDVKQKAFDPFFTTKPPGKHTGQGLTIVLASIVRRHHGEVELASEDGYGTSATIRIPILNAAK
jgi:signal transduction histidine kinase